MAIITRYLDSAATGAGNGTSWADAYTTWSAWNTAEANNLVTNGNSHVLKVRGNIQTLTVELLFTGWTTGTSNTLTIEADIADQHQGVYSSSKPGVIMNGSVFNGGRFAFDTPCGHVTIRGLQFRNALTYSGSVLAGSISWLGSASGYFLNVENCLFISASTTATNQTGVRYDANTFTLRVKNCVFIGFNQATSSAITNAGTNPTSYVYNNTFRSCTTAVIISTNTRLVNNIFSSNTTDVSGTPHSSTNYNLTNQASFPVGSNNVINTSLTFVNSAANNYLLSVSDTAAMGTGIGPASDAEVPIIDVIGNTRSGTTTDIGFDMYVASGLITSAWLKAL